MSGTPRIICVTPTCRPESMASFVKAWTPLFERHQVTLITVWDGDEPQLQIGDGEKWRPSTFAEHRDLFCRHTDVVRNLGFVAAARLNPDYVLTLDDDVAPPVLDNTQRLNPLACHDPIQAHLDALNLRVPLGWMNTAHAGSEYLRGVPYGVRDEAPVMLSHGVWVGTPDFDGDTQLRLEGRHHDPLHPNNYLIYDGVKPEVPYSLPYYVGPVPRGVLFPLCGMNVMVRREALPHFYFAPMGPDAGVFEEREVDQSAGGTHRFKVPTLHRFGDIWMGVMLKREFDRLGWACYTGASTILHTRASDARKNFEQEKLGRAWNERIATWSLSDNAVWRADGANESEWNYFRSYADKRARYAALIESILPKTT